MAPTSRIWRRSTPKIRAARRTVGCCRRLRVAARFRSSSRRPSILRLARPPGVIRTSYGFHIIHVEAKQQARLKPLDEVKSQIEPLIKQQEAASQAQNLANTVQTLARTVGLDKAASEKGLPVITTDFVSQTDPLPGVGNAKDLDSALFAAKKNDPPGTAPTSQGYAIYQVTDIQPPQTPTFEQIKAQVEQQFKEQRAQMSAGAKDPGTIRPCPCGARPEEGGQGSGRHAQDQ